MLIGSNMAFFAGGPSPVVCTLTDHAVDSANASSYTFSAKSLGAASADRKIVVAALRNSGGSTAGVSSMTIGGISATLIVAKNHVNECNSELWQANVPTGTTGDIVVNWGSSANRMGIGVWAVTGAAAAAYATSSSGSSVDNLTTTINCPASGCVIAGAAGNSSTFVWSGVTERFEDAPEGTNQKGSGASDNFAAAQTGLTVACATTGGGDSSMVVCSFGPL